MVDHLADQEKIGCLIKSGYQEKLKNQYTSIALLPSHWMVLGGPTNMQSERTLFVSL